MEQIKLAAFVPTFSASLSAQIYDGVNSAVDQLEEQNIELVPYYFDGGLISTNSNDFVSSFIYEFGKSTFFDGILVFGGVLGYLLSPQELNDFCVNFSTIPIMNIGIGLDDVPSVKLDNYQGMYDMVEHQLEYHGYRKPFFIRGPEGHQEADIRFEAYLDCLKSHGIVFEDEAVFHGDFTVASGHGAAERFFSPDFTYKSDCIIASNDEMAFGFISRAQEFYDLSIPGDLPISGFDNSDFSDSLFPPLTTVDHPFSKMAERACLELVKMVKDTSMKKNDVIIKPKLLIRRSCGCNNSELEDISSLLLLEDIKPDSITCTLLSKENILKLDDISALCLQEGEQKSFQLFLNAFYDFVEKRSSLFSVEEQSEIISYVKNTIISKDPDFDVKMLFIILSQAQLIFNKSHLRRERQYNVLNRDSLYHLSQLKHELDRATGLAEMKRALNTTLDDMDIHTLAIFLFSPKGQLQKLTPFFMYFDGAQDKSLEDSKTLEMGDLYSYYLSNKSRQGQFIFSPLVYKNEILGIAFYDIPSSSLILTSDISVYISGFIHNYLLLEERREKTRELEKTISRLKKVRGQLLEAEKQAALGKLVAGISHEMNTPMGNGISAISFLQSKLDDMYYLLNEDRLRKKDLTDFLDKSGELSSILMKSLQKAAKLLETFKKVDIDVGEDDSELFYLHSTLDNSLSFFSHNIIRKGLRVHINCPPSLTLYGNQKLFLQIFKSLIENSIEHGFHALKNGNINIDCHEDDSQVLISYWDDGVGIPEDELPHIFEPFFTTGRIDGSVGLGLHIVYILICNKMGGTIKVESSPGVRTLFHMSFPKDTREIGSIEDVLEESSGEDISLGSFKDLGSQLVHDLNTPLGVSLSLVSLMNDTLENKNSVPIEELTSQLFLNLERIRETLQNFKDLCSDNNTAELQVIPLKEYLEGVIGSLSTLLKEKKVSVKFSCPAGIFIKIPANYLFRVMSNLITNSLFHAFIDVQGERLIEVDIEKHNYTIHIEYKDNGRGVSEDTLENIFKPYFTTGKKRGRTGLGMYIIHKLVTGPLNGDIRCGNREDGGFLCLMDFEPEIVDI